MRLSERTKDLHGQPMFHVLEKAKQLEAEGKDIVHLEIGDPDLKTPQHIVDAVRDAIDRGETHYCPSTGLPELKRAAADVTLRSRGFKPDMDQLLPTEGANPQLFAAMWCTTLKGESVLIPDPGFPSYEATATLAGARTIKYPLNGVEGYMPHPRDLIPLITPQTRLLIVNSPSNPTGGVVSKERWQELYDLCVQHDLTLLSDEVYSRMIYDGEFYSPSMIDHCRDRVVVVNGFSKSFGMTGWRLGVCTGPKHLIEKMALCLESIYSCVQPFIQWGGVAALRGPQDAIMAKVGEYKQRRDVLVSGLKTLGMSVASPMGGLYVWVRTECSAEDLLENYGIACCPGEIFGMNGRGHIRFSFACEPKERIKEAVERMVGKEM